MDFDLHRQDRGRRSHFAKQSELTTGMHKDAQLVYDAFATVQGDLSQIELFHTDRGSEFKNQLIDEMLDVF